MPSEVKIEIDKIVGYVYPIKDQLKEAGARWNPNGKFWYINEKSDVVKISYVIQEFNKKNNVYRWCERCGGKCKLPFTTCCRCKELEKEKEIDTTCQCNYCEADIDMNIDKKAFDLKRICNKCFNK